MKVGRDQVRITAQMALVGLALAAGAGAALGGLRAPGIEEAAATSTAVAASDYAIDAVHSAVIFRIKHNEAAYNYGRFNGIDGVVNFSESEGVTGVKVNVDTNSVDTANEKRDNHLRGADFFSAKQFPKATFKSTSVSKKSEHDYEVAGEFTLNGVTKPLTVTLTHTGSSKTQMGEVAGFETVFTIKRSDFGMTKYLPMVGDEVRLMIGLETIKQ